MASEPQTTLLLNLILTTNTQATKIKSSFLITYAVKGFQCHSNRSRNSLN